MAEDAFVELDPAFIGEVIGGLNEKRLLVEKELNSLGKAPRGVKDIFHQCRNFERAYAVALENPEVTSRIRKVFNSQEGLTGLVKQLPLDQRFQLLNVKAVCREADGYQGHLVSPEFGLKRLIEDAMLLVLDPVVTAVHRVHLLLVEAARMASRNAGKYTEDGRFDEKRTSQFPAFERAILNYATQCLDGWRDKAIETANSLVDMEQDYVTAAFFRHAIAQRQQHIQQLEDMQQIMDGGGMRPADEDDESEDDDDDDEDDDDDDEESDADSATKPAPRQMSSLQPQRPAPTMPAKAPGDDDFKMGYLEKRIGEHSGRQNLPEGWKWQKRWFVFTDTKGMLYYFKTADDPPNYRGVIDIKQCKVEDMDANGIVVPAGRQSSTGPSVLIKIAHKDPSKPAVKKHHSIVLRAETPAEKYSWLRRLKISAEGPGAARHLPPRLTLASTAGADGAGSKARRGGGPEATGAAANGVERGYPGGPTVMPDSNESFMDGEKGLGMAIPEEATAKLGPLPSLMGSNRTAHDEETDTTAYDAFLEQLAEDTKQYVIAVFKTLTATVPKAIIHAQVKQSQEHLLERLYAYVTGLKPNELEHLLDEDTEVTQKRAAAQMSVKDITASIVELKKIEEKRARTNEDERPLKEPVPRSAIEQSGLWDLLPGGRTEQGSNSPYGQYTPRSLQGKTPFTESRLSPDASRPVAANGTSVPRMSAGAPRPTSAGAAPGAPSPLTAKPRRRPPPAPPGQ